MNVAPFILHIIVACL